MGGEKEALAEGGVVPFYKLFVCADRLDKLLRLVGTIAAIGNGMNPPLMALLFGQMTDAFARPHTHKLLHFSVSLSI